LIFHMYSGRKALIYIMQYLLMASQYYILQIKYCMYKKIKMLMISII